MKRKFDPAQHYHAKLGDIKSDFSSDQLQAIGALAMNYNEMEGYIDTLFFQVTNLPENLRLDVSTRINGIEGKIEIIKEGAKEFDLIPEDLSHLNIALGSGTGFLGLKAYRDAVIHARAWNAPEESVLRLIEERQSPKF